MCMSVFVSACELVCAECRCTWTREGVGSPGAGVPGQESGPPAGCWAAHRALTAEPPLQPQGADSQSK